MAIEKENIEIVKLLLSINDIDIDVINRIDRENGTFEETALFAAIQQNSIGIIQTLLSCKSFNINVKQFHKGNEGSSEKTILFCAVENGNYTIIQLLLNNKTLDANDKSKYTYEVEKNGMEYEITSEITPLKLAVEKQNIEIIQLLTQNEKIDINQFSVISDFNRDQEETALNVAVETRNAKIVEILLESKNMNCNIKNKYTKYIDKTSNKTKKEIHEEEEEETQLDEETEEKGALHIAIENNDLEIVQLLLNNEKTDVNDPKITKNVQHLYDCEILSEETALSIAVQKGNADIVQLLLSSEKVDINKPSTTTEHRSEEESNVLKKRTALHDAVEEWNQEIICLLIEHGIDSDIQDEKGRTAIEYTDNYIIKVMLKLRKGKLPLNILERTEYIRSDDYFEIYNIQNAKSNEKYVGNIHYKCFEDYPKETQIKIMNDMNKMAQIKHSSIMEYFSFYPYGTHNDSRPVILTASIPQYSLSDVLKNSNNIPGNQKWNDAKKLINLYGIALGMSHLHELNILHYDLTPSNIIEDQNLYPKIKNYGILRSFISLLSILKIHKFSRYAAPEVLTDNIYTQKSDVYSFGVIAYTIITNHALYDECSQIQFSTKIIEGTIPSIDETIQPFYHDLIKKCLSPNPEDRPSFYEIVQDIENNKENIIDSSEMKEFDDYIEYINQNKKDDNQSAYQGAEKSKNDNDTNNVKTMEKRKRQRKGKNDDENEEEEEEEDDDDTEKPLIIKNVNTVNIANYEKIALLGKGGYGSVFLVNEKKSQNAYTAKQTIELISARYRENKIAKYLIQEVTNLSHCDYENILKFIGYSPKNFKKEFRPVIVTDYYPKGSLKSILDQIRKEGENSVENWNDRTQFIIIYKTALSMQYLHEKMKILHRDLNPNNILVDEDLNPKLADFGLSIPISITNEDDVVGTCRYIAPEIFSDTMYSIKSDVYAFAIMVHEVITQKIPFEGLSDFRIQYIVSIENERLSLDSVGDNYRQLIQKCWAQDPNERPTFTEIIDELHNFPEYTKFNINDNKKL